MNRLRRLAGSPDRHARPWVGVAILVLAGSAAVSSAETDTDFAATLMAGYDGNPLKVTGDGPGGAFSELRLDSGIETRMSPRLAGFLNGGGRARLYGSSTSNADFHSADVRTGFVLAPVIGDRNRLRITFGGAYAVSRSTYRNRATGEVYEVLAEPPTVPASSVPIPDRFDVNTSSAFVDLRWRPSRRVRFSVDTRIDNADYVRDYSATTGLEALDYRARTVEPEVLLALHRVLAVSLSYTITDVDYEHQPALDDLGQPVAGALRRYDYSNLRLTIRVAPSSQWRLRFGLRDGDRQDAHAGYYDYRSDSTFVSLDHRPSRRVRLQLYTSHSDLDYENAVVPGDPNGEFRSSSVDFYLGRFDLRLNEHLSFFTEGGSQRTDSQDPVFAYDRDWLLTGITYRR